MRIVYYYQKFIGLQEVIKNKGLVNTINISSIHFKNGKINLNDFHPDMFYLLWKDAKKVSEDGTYITLMVGGAGGAYEELFGNYELYYKQLKELIMKYDFINGIDIDIEEQVDIDDVKKLIRDIRKDFGKNFLITFAPVADLMQVDKYDNGFSYKELYNSVEGKEINRFNVQCYSDYSEECYDAIIVNGYPPNKIVFGMFSYQYTEDNFNLALKTVSKLKEKYPDFGGVYVWEYFIAPPSKNPIDFAILMNERTNEKTNKLIKKMTDDLIEEVFNELLIEQNIKKEETLNDDDEELFNNDVKDMEGLFNNKIKEFEGVFNNEIKVTEELFNNNGVENVEEVFNNEIKDAEEMFNDKIKEFEKMFNNGVENVEEEVFNNEIKEFEEMFNNGVENAEEVFNNEIKDVEELFNNNVKEVFNNNVENAEKVFNNNVENVEETFNNDVENIEETFNNEIKNVEETFNNNVKEIEENIVYNIKDVEETIDNEIKNIEEDIKKIKRKINEEIIKLNNEKTDEEMNMSKEEINEMIVEQESSRYVDYCVLL